MLIFVGRLEMLEGTEGIEETEGAEGIDGTEGREVEGTGFGPVGGCKEEEGDETRLGVDPAITGPMGSPLRRLAGSGPVTALNMLAMLPWRLGEAARLPRASEAIPAGMPPTEGMPGGALGTPVLPGNEKETACVTKFLK
jgi:hypothetical protein